MIERVDDIFTSGDEVLKKSVKLWFIVQEEKHINLKVGVKRLGPVAELAEAIIKDLDIFHITHRSNNS
jgi:hypothetical protein